MTEYTVLTPVGGFKAYWPDDEDELVQFSGSPAGIAYLEHHIESNMLTREGGFKLSLNTLEPSDLFNFCQSEEAGITVVPDALDGVMLNDDEGDPMNMFDGVSVADEFAMIGEGAQILKRLSEDSDTFFADLGRLREIVVALGGEQSESDGLPDRIDYNGPAAGTPFGNDDAFNRRHRYLQRQIQEAGGTQVGPNGYVIKAEDGGRVFYAIKRSLAESSANSAAEPAPVAAPAVSPTQEVSIPSGADEYQAKMIAEINDLRKSAVSAGYSPVSYDQYMAEINSGNRLGYSMDSMKERLAEYQKSIADLQSGLITPRSVVGTGGTKKSAMEFLQSSIAEASAGIESGGILNDTNLRNYSSYLRTLIRTGKDDSYKSDENIDAEQKARAEYEAKAIAEAQALADKAAASRNYQVGSEDGMKSPLSFVYSISTNGGDGIIAGLADIPAPEDKYAYLEEKIKGGSGIVKRVDKTPFNKMVDFNGARRKGVQFGFFQIEPRAGFSKVTLTIDLSGKISGVQLAADGATPADANKAIAAISPFLSAAQRGAIKVGMLGEEGQYFRDKAVEMAKVIADMPKTYEQDGKGDSAVVYLHYFTGSADWYITEKDMSGEGTEQAFGYADLGHGGELGYISIAEIVSAGADLDLHWTPKTLGAVKGNGDEPGNVQGADMTLADFAPSADVVKGWTDAEYQAEYAKLEDENMRGEALLLKAKRYGSVDQMNRAVELINMHDKAGGVTYKVRDGRNALEYELNAIAAPSIPEPAPAPSEDQEQDKYTKFDLSQLRMPSANQLGLNGQRTLRKFTIDGVMGWTNGHILDLAGIPKGVMAGIIKYRNDLNGVADIQESAVEKVLSQAKTSTVEVSPVSFYDGSSEKVVSAIAANRGDRKAAVETVNKNLVILASDDDGLVVIADPKYVAYFLKNYRGAKFYAGSMTGHMLVKQNGKVIGIMMPVNDTPVKMKLARSAAAVVDEQNPIPAPEVTPDPAPATTQEQGPNEPTPKPTEDSALSEAKQYLQSVIDGAVPFDEALSGKLEDLYSKFEGDADFMGLFEQAANAYSDAMIQAAKSAMA